MDGANRLLILKVEILEIKRRVHKQYPVYSPTWVKQCS